MCTCQASAAHSSLKCGTSFVRKGVKDYNGNEGIDSEIILTLMFLQFWYDIVSERELMQILPERLNYLWFLSHGLTDEILGKELLKEALKKNVSPGHKRQIAGIFVNRGLCSEPSACRHFGLHCSTFKYEAKQSNAWLDRLKIALKRLSRFKT